MFAFYNLETSILAYHGKKNNITKYVNELFKDKEHEKNNIEDQFEGLDFG